MLKKFRAATLLMLLFLCSAASIASAQSALSVLENRLCKTWKIERIEQGGKITTADKSLNDFVMIINADHTVRQGMYPDAMITGKWSFDETSMMFVIKDDTTEQEYHMKVNSVTTDELILQDTSSISAVFIHYHAK